MNNNELQKLIATFANKTGSNAEVVQNNVNNGKVDELMKSLNEKQAQQVQSILNDPKKTQEILNSPAAQALMKRLMNNG